MRLNIIKLIFECYYTGIWKRYCFFPGFKSRIKVKWERMFVTYQIVPAGLIVTFAHIVIILTLLKITYHKSHRVNILSKHQQTAFHYCYCITETEVLCQKYCNIWYFPVVHSNLCNTCISVQFMAYIDIYWEIGSMGSKCLINSLNSWYVSA